MDAFDKSLHGVGGFGDASRWSIWKLVRDPRPKKCIRDLPLIHRKICDVITP